MCRQQVSVLNKKFMLNSVGIVDVALQQADCTFLQDGAFLPVLIERKAVRDLGGINMHDHLSLEAADVKEAMTLLMESFMEKGQHEPVSYTHLTLPTIYSV